jgi:hypothetical protein
MVRLEVLRDLHPLEGTPIYRRTDRSFSFKSATETSSSSQEGFSVASVALDTLQI